MESSGIEIANVQPEPTEVARLVISRNDDVELAVVRRSDGYTEVQGLAGKSLDHVHGLLECAKFVAAGVSVTGIKVQGLAEHAAFDVITWLELSKQLAANAFAQAALRAAQEDQQRLHLAQQLRRNGKGH